MHDRCCKEYIVTQSSGNHAQAGPGLLVLSAAPAVMASNQGDSLGLQATGQEGATTVRCETCVDALYGEAIVVMPEDSPSVKVSAVRDTYGAEAFFPSQIVLRDWLCTVGSCRSGSAKLRKRRERSATNCPSTVPHRVQCQRQVWKAMSAEIVADLRQKYGSEKAEEIHPNQDDCWMCECSACGMKMYAQNLTPDSAHISPSCLSLIAPGFHVLVQTWNRPGQQAEWL